MKQNNKHNNLIFLIGILLIVCLVQTAWNWNQEGRITELERVQSIEDDFWPGAYWDCSESKNIIHEEIVPMTYDQDCCDGVIHEMFLECMLNCDQFGSSEAECDYQCNYYRQSIRENCRASYKMMDIDVFKRLKQNNCFLEARIINKTYTECVKEVVVREV